MAENDPVRYGMKIQLVHQLTGARLKSLSKLYSHPGSSKQQMVIAGGAVDRRAIWIVRSAHGEADPANWAAVGKDAIIRLEHEATDTMLHSHNAPAPIESGQQEITTYRDGDENDNWIVEPNDGATWHLNQPVRLIHSKTKMALHSHGTPDEAKARLGGQEVTGFKTRDENDWWLATEIVEPRYSVGVGAASDLPTTDDHLGQNRLVRGLRDFLTSEKTATPLTLSVEAQWGAGKSSFMLKLWKELPDAKFLKVWFNPWRHEKNEQLWAAFALCLVEQLEGQLTWRQRVWARAQYGWAVVKRRSLLSDLVPKVVKLVLWLLVLIVGGIFLVEGFTDGDFQRLWLGSTEGTGTLKALAQLVGAPVAVAIAGVWLWKLADSIVGRPASFDLNDHLDRPDYSAKASFLENFHRDFRCVLRAYAENRKIAVFIDDVDRCEVPRAADLVQGINLLMSGAEPEQNSDEKTAPPQLLFILGMDRSKVAAGIAAKHASILPYLQADRRGVNLKSDEAALIRFGLEYGYEYLEKFIQIPFRLPAVPDEQMTNFIAQLLQRPDVPTPQVEPPKEKKETAKSPDAELPIVGKGVVGAMKLPSSEINEAWLEEPTLLAAPLFGNNPRRVKQYVAMLRLNAYLLLEGRDLDRTTIRQLGKFLAMTMRWPALVADVESDSTVFLEIDGEEQETDSAISKKWRRNLEFMAFNESRPVRSDSETHEAYDLRVADIRSFLTVTSVTRPDEKIAQKAN